MQFAADFAYTLNHAIVCTITDPIIDVPVGATVQNMLAGMRGEDHKISLSQVADGLKPSHILGHFKSSVNFKKEEGERFSPATSWLAGEVAGDFGAVPVVVALQHFAPSAVNGLGKLAAPIARPFFEHAAKRRVQAEFKLEGQEAKGAEFSKKVDEIVHHELDALPSAILWTAASPAINILMQKTVMGNKAPVTDLLLAKGMSATVTSGITVGLRGVAPDKAQQWDEKITNTVGKPVSNVMAKLLRVDKDELQSEMRKHAEKDSLGKWQKQIASQPEAERNR